MITTAASAATRRPFIAWSACGLALALSAIGLWLAIASWSIPAPPGITPRGFALLLTLPFAVIGGLITARVPGNAIGPAFLCLGVAGGVQFLSEQIAFAADVWPALSPVAPAAAMLSVALGMINSLSTSLYVVALFPSGRFATSNEARAVLLGTVALAIYASVTLLIGEPLPVPNARVTLPIVRADTPLPLLVGAMALLTYALAFGVVALGLIRRFRDSRGVARQQFKWFAYAAALMASTSIIAWAGVAVVYVIVGPTAFVVPSAEVRALIVLNIVGYAAMPLAIGFAVLRYRLYEIDVLIRRTVIYGAVSVGLSGIYVAAVVILQGAFRPVTGGSGFAVALSTLLVVALFQPFRLAVQDAVDRRFYRSRYDSGRTTDAFIARLRNDVELESIRADLLDVVNSTVHPAHAGMWLRGDRR